MKKILLTTSALITLALSVNAQRMTLHQEFTGENCGPCAATNPAFWTLCDESTNTGKLIHISIMDDIPSAGFYCNRTSAIYNWYNTYYSVPFAPYGRYDGHVPDPTASSPGHPYYFTQADIDAEAAIPDSFSMSVTNSWNATFDSIVVVVSITSTAAWTGTTPYLRAALVQTNNFITPPGTNGESHFENVVQAMYPGSGSFGTALPTSWPMGTVQTYTITGAVPSFVDKSGSPYMVVWIQDDANKVISQAAQSTPLPGIATDVAATVSAGIPGMVCAGTSYSAVHNVTLKNSGTTTTLTSAQIFYRVDAGAYSSYAWSGSLAPGATTVVTMPAVSVPAVPQGSNHTITDSVGMPNGIADINSANNLSGVSFFIEGTTGVPQPYSTSFENFYNGDSLYYFTDNASNGDIWNIWQTGSSALLGHSGTYAAGFPFINFAPGTVNSIVLPEVNITNPATTSISFWVSYSQQTTSNTDQLDVVYSTDCGSTWTSLWNMSGSAMVTLPASTTGYSYPTSPSQYNQYTASLSGVTAGPTMLAFRATDGGGNFIFVDDVDIRVTTAVQNVASSTGISVYPNPAKDEATLSFNLTAASSVQIQVVDELGRTMSVVANDNLDAGAHTFTINTTELASGVYTIMIHTEGGMSTQRLSIVK